MSLQCQKIELKKLPFLASDITNFTSAVCAVVLEVFSDADEPKFNTWANTYSADLYSSYTTVLNFSSSWINTDDPNVNSFVYSNSANILQVDNTVNSNSANWNSVYNSYNLISGSFLTNNLADIRYVKLSGDVMTGGLSAPSLSTDTLYVAGSTINFFDESGNIIETLKSNDVGNFKSNYTLTNSRSAKWEEVYTEFSAQSSNNSSIYNTVYANSGDWNYQGTDIKTLTSNWEDTYVTVQTYSGNWTQFLSFDEFTSELSISNGNSVSLSSIGKDYLPLSGGTLTGDLRINADITSVDSIQFNLAAGAAAAMGQLSWNAAESTLDLGVNADVTLQLGQETIIQVKNTSGEIIRNGWAVYASGAVGTGSGNIAISAYQANFNGVNDLYLLGVATQEIADNDFGFVTTIGKVRDVLVSEVQESTDASPWDIGTILYVSATERGRFTSVAPLPPNEILPIAMIVGVNGNKRIFFVRANHGYTLNELHNVYILSATDGQTITWDAANSYWKNTTPYNGSDVKTLTANWENTYSQFSIQSGNNISVYNSVNVNSATTWNYQGNDLKALSGNWENAYNTVQSNSANWDYQGVDIKALTANWENTYSQFASQSSNNISVYTTVQTNSAITWNYQGTDIKSLTSNWENTYNEFSDQSGNNVSVYNTVNVNSASWINEAPQTLSFNSINAELTISNGNTVSLSALSGSSESDPIFTSWAQTYSANYESTYNTVNQNSATTWNYQGNDLKVLSGNWENTYTNFSIQSANNLSVYSTFNSVSSNIISGTILGSNQSMIISDLISQTVKTFDYVTASEVGSPTPYGYVFLIGEYVVSDINSEWSMTFSPFTRGISWTYNVDGAGSEIYYFSFIAPDVTTNLNWVLPSKSGTLALYSDFSEVVGLSSNWNSVYNTVNSNSASWVGGGDNLEVNSFVNSNSANIIQVDSLVNSNSGNWDSSYTTVNTNSASWGGGTLQTLSFNELNAELTISGGNTVSLSSLSGVNTGGSGLTQPQVLTRIFFKI